MKRYDDNMRFTLLRLRERVGLYLSQLELLSVGRNLTNKCYGGASRRKSVFNDASAPEIDPPTVAQIRG